MGLLERIGEDIGRRMPLEEAIDWAAARSIRHIDIGLHTLSAVNVAEYAPFVSEAVDAYLEAYIAAMPRLGARHVVVHAGYHFTADVEMRMRAGLERLKRMVERAERAGARLLLENLNKEPPEAEVHYLAHTVEEWRHDDEAIDSPAFALSRTANHAHLMPEGVEGFTAEEMHLARARQVAAARAAGVAA
jgi:sugar phosphate isomerase/epimerase